MGIGETNGKEGFDRSHARVTTAIDAVRRRHIQLRFLRIAGTIYAACIFSEKPK